LIYGLEGQKIVISVSNLEGHMDLFKQIGSADLIPVMKKTYVDARLYYVLESKKNGKLFDVAMQCGFDNDNMFVNGIEVRGKAILYEVIMPFIPEDVVKEWYGWLSSGNQEMSDG
jgi:hypothetical protein